MDAPGGRRRAERVGGVQDISGLWGEHEGAEWLFTGWGQGLEQGGERPACWRADVNDGLAVLHGSPMFGIKSR